MKKIFVIAIAFVSLQAVAQKREGNHKNEMRKERHFKDMSAEDLAQLKTKKMTLHLDLDDAQKSKVYNLVLEQVKQRKSKLASKKELKEKLKMTKSLKKNV